VGHLLHDILEVPEQTNKKGDFGSWDDDVLERVGRKYPEHAWITDGVRSYRGFKKQIGFLQVRLSELDCLHSSTNVGAAWTGRFSSSKDPFKRGTNVQNVAPKHRHIFVARPGKKLGYLDLSQSDSRVVAYDAGDEAYIAAHESGNVHVHAARIFFPEVDWTGDDKLDKVICKETPLPWDDDHTYYDQSKRNQHGLNFGLGARGLAMHTHCPVKQGEAAYERYFAWAPKVKAWQREKREELQRTGVLTTPLERRCQFFGRLKDPHTIRQAISFIPQGMTADIINIGLWSVWKEMDPWTVQLLAQVHDAILFEYDEEEEETVIPRVLALLRVPVRMRDDRIMVIPVEAELGWNWGHRTKDNPRGMV
jgi:DNA polymerase-1